MKPVIDDLLREATILNIYSEGNKTTEQTIVLKEAKNIEMVNRIGEILSEASIFDSKYEE